jgi:hypothetical protein
LKTACKHGTNVETHEIHERRNESLGTQDGRRSENHSRQVRRSSGKDRIPDEAKGNRNTTDLKETEATNLEANPGRMQSEEENREVPTEDSSVEFS